MISKLVNEYVGFQAKKNNMSVDAYIKKILKKHIPIKKGRNGHARP
jgi:hypothetical protein